MGAVDELSAEQVEHAKLRAEEDEEAHDQRPGPQERTELKPELVGRIRGDVEIRDRGTGGLAELIDDHRGEHHAEERADEEDGPLVDEEVLEPTFPAGDVLRVFRENHAGGPHLHLLAAHEARDVPDSVAHPVPFVPIVADRHVVQAGGEGREARQRTEVGRARARRRGGGDDEGGEGTAPNGRGDHDDRDDGDRGEDEHHHDPVRDLQGSGDLLAEQGDHEHDEEESSPQRLDGRKLSSRPRAPKDEREETLPRVGRPAPPDEGEVEQADREGGPQEESRRHAAEGDDGGLARGDRKASKLDIVEDL